MKKWVLFGLLVPLSLLAYRYEPVLLKTQAKLAPRLLMMTKGIAYSAPNRFGICIVHEAGEKDVAAQVKQTLLAYYPSGWQYHSMRIVIAEYGAVKEQCADTEVLFMLNGSEERVREMVSFATKTRKLTIAYDNRYLADGVLVSLHVGRSLRPYLNLNQAKAAELYFDSALKRVAKFYVPSEDAQ